ncbi:hypothetical protein C6N75_26880 [Streptomyces solincola]|uniref:DUF4352 domain-containing protein n=1 Tax=Streptomyces solincola TaxID=2100817 RepID=A0A2S9PP67_9ACTN|nr:MULTISPECIES: DUF4190 domain-containing protein [Streptomyces]PRH76206.1 hypothetical protein C6N75_26880 [Streptomyces solincola]
MSDSTQQPQYGAPQQPGGYGYPAPQQGGYPGEAPGGYPGAPGGAYPAPESGYGGPAQARNGLGVAALVCGIIGAVSGVVPFLFWLAGLLGLLALIFGLVGRGRAKRGEATNKGVATTGAVLGLVSLILAVVGVVIVVNAVDDAVDEINKEVDKAIASSAPKTPAPAADKGGDGAEPAAEDEAGKKKDETLAGGDTVIYDDDLKVTVSEPKKTSASEFAIGHTQGNQPYEVIVVIENAGTEKFDAGLVTADARAGAEGTAAEEIFDGDTYGNGFSGTILPGKKATVKYAFDAPKGAESLTVELSPGISHEANQWELKL